MCAPVLIGTLWNVNVTFRSADRYRRYVLIGTLWNVNNLAFGQSPPWKSCFNRYIVECKLYSPIRCYHASIVLIGTLWNVNYEEQILDESTSSFNRYIVECKLILRMNQEN